MFVFKKEVQVKKKSIAKLFVETLFASQLFDLNTDLLDVEPTAIPREGERVQ
jgi:hypothetical protein